MKQSFIFGRELRVMQCQTWTGVASARAYNSFWCCFECKLEWTSSNRVVSTRFGTPLWKGEYEHLWRFSILWSPEYSVSDFKRYPPPMLDWIAQTLNPVFFTGSAKMTKFRNNPGFNFNKIHYSSTATIIKKWDNTFCSPRQFVSVSL